MSDYLPIDVLIEILSRLPVKTLLRFTAVSKKWYCLILSPSFISKHLDQSTSLPISKNHILLVMRSSENERFLLRLENDMFATYAELESPFSRVRNFVRIVGTCNGLICLADAHDKIVIWNPCLKKLINLPNPIFPNVSEGPPTFLGFGYDSVTNDYKVVRIVYHLSFPDDLDYFMPPNVEIYSLSTKVWRSKCDIALMYDVFDYFPAPAFVDGHIHWITSKRCQNGKLLSNVVLGFDVSNEVFREVKIPEILAKIDVLNLAVLSCDKSIALVQYDKVWASEYCWVWKMEEYNVVESWARVLMIDLREGRQKVVSLQRNNVVILFDLEEGLVTYDPQTKHIQSLGIHQSLLSLFMDNFVESLVLLKGEKMELFELETSGSGGVDREISSPELGDDAITSEQVQLQLE